MTAPARAAWWLYILLLLIILSLPALCSALEPLQYKLEESPIADAPTVIDWDKKTVTMSLGLWHQIMDRIQSQDEYIKNDRDRLKKEIEAEIAKKQCI